MTFIDEKIFSSVISNSQESLDAIERQVNTVLNKTRKPIQPNKEIAKILASEIKKIEMPTIGASASLNNVKRTQKPLSLLTKKKLTKITKEFLVYINVETGKEEAQEQLNDEACDPDDSTCTLDDIDDEREFNKEMISFPCDFILNLKRSE